MPSSVIRTPTGIAKTMVAMTAGTVPRLKKMMAGIRYTNAGSVCMTSSTGRTSMLAARLRAAHTPSGTASSSATAAETTTSDSDCIAWSHWATPSISAKPAKARTPVGSPRIQNASIARMPAISSGEGPPRTHSTAS